jgi:hypothetical protein
VIEVVLIETGKRHFRWLDVIFTILEILTNPIRWNRVIDDLEQLFGVKDRFAPIVYDAKIFVAYPNDKIVSAGAQAPRD